MPTTADLAPHLPTARTALESALDALAAAEAAGRPAARALALAQVGRCYRSLGDIASAAWYLQQGLRWSRTLGAPDSSIELLCDLAELAVDHAEAVAPADDRAAHAQREAARDHGFEATRLAARSADPTWEVSVLLRVSDVLDRCGDHDDAIALQCRALDLIAQPFPPRTPQAAGSVALN